MAKVKKYSEPKSPVGSVAERFAGVGGFRIGLVGTYLFGSQLPVAWGTIGASVMSLVILLTLENFPIYLEEAIAVNALAIPFLLSYVFIIVFTVLNLLIGIVLNAMDEAREEAKEQDKKPQGLDLIAKDLEQINEDGVITKEEIVALKKEVARLRKLLKEN